MEQAIDSGTQQAYGNGLIEAPQPLSRPENTIRPISIGQLNYGYQVQVGCHSFAFETKEKMLLKLAEYINNPAETEVKWFTGDLFKG